MKEAIYLAELNLPNSSAHSIHVMKMCSSLSKKNFNTKLFIFHSDEKIDEFYNYKCNNKFKIISIFKKKKKLNFFNRLIYSFSVLFKISKANLIISRSLISSLILSLFKKKNIVELHHEPKGVTKYLFFFLSNIINLKKYLKVILIHPYILNRVNLKKFDYLILDDAVDIDDFNNNSKSDFNKKDAKELLYVGSFFSGKGIEIISQVAKKLKKINFHLYGDLKTLSSEFRYLMEYENISFKGNVSYSKIPDILNKYSIVLMPYLKNVSVRSGNLDVGLNMSPLKMFDYLAAGKIILASDLEVYKHILKDNFNCFLIDPENIDEWIKKINQITSNIDSFNFLKKNSNQTSKYFTWDKRIDKIIDFNI